MDIQLKRGLLEVCVLAALEREDSYGYKIIKDVSECIEISESTLYPILKRLEGNGCLSVYSIEHNGRLRKYYQITLEGKNKIREFLNEWNTMTEIYNFIKSSLRSEKTENTAVQEEAEPEDTSCEVEKVQGEVVEEETSEEACDVQMVEGQTYAQLEDKKEGEE